MADETKLDYTGKGKLIGFLLVLVLLVIVIAICILPYIVRKGKHEDPEQKSIRHAVDEESMQCETS